MKKLVKEILDFLFFVFLMAILIGGIWAVGQVLKEFNQTGTEKTRDR